MSDRSRLIDHRVAVARLGLGLSWLALAGHAIAVATGPGLDGIDRWGPIAGLGLALLILTVTPWRRTLQGRVGDWFVAIWATGVIAGLLVAEREWTSEPLAAAYLFPAALAAAMLLRPWMQAAISAAAVGGYIAAFGDQALEGDAVAIGVRYGAFMATVGLLAMVSGSLRRRLVDTARTAAELEERRAELARKEEELDRLYSVSRTIGTGSNLAEVLPELVGRVVAAVDAKIGLVLLYRHEVEALEVMSPIWVAGHTLRAEGYQLKLTEAGITQRVFTSGEGMIENDVGSSPLRDALLTDLDTSQVAAVPLRIEARTIGVLLVADKTEGAFTPDDLETLESLAGPSALVLNQMSRYEEARETGAKMAELAQLKTDFVSVVSHELRTPLTSIIGSLKTLARPELAPTDPNALGLLTTAQQQANRLRTLIEDLLMVSRIDNRALPVRPEPIVLVPFLEDVVGGIPEASRRVLIDVDPALTALEADPDHLRRILTNLVENAQKYAPGSSIEVQVRPSGNEVWISVVDHGPGIPYELHDHIFDQFTQVGRHDTRSGGGTGLGLSIVRGLSEAMGGRVWFEPTIGGGATFTVALPRSPGVVGAGPTEPARI